MVLANQPIMYCAGVVFLLAQSTEQAGMALRDGIGKNPPLDRIIFDTVSSCAKYVSRKTIVARQSVSPATISQLHKDVRWAIVQLLHDRLTAAGAIDLSIAQHDWLIDHAD